MKLTFSPLTPGRWDDFVELFGERGACGGCWCMWWKLKRTEFDAQKGSGNRRAMYRSVESGTMPGILAYDRARPVGWCAVEPRDRYPVLARSRVLKPIDEQPVWSVTCFFILKTYRKRGVSVRLLREAVRYVRSHGGVLVEGYPVEPRKQETADVFAYTGLFSAFQRVGFKECARRSATRPIMRLKVRPARAG